MNVRDHQIDLIREVMLDIFRARLPDGSGDDGINEPFADDEYTAMYAAGLRVECGPT